MFLRQMVYSEAGYASMVWQKGLIAWLFLLRQKPLPDSQYFCFPVHKEVKITKMIKLKE